MQKFPVEVNLWPLFTPDRSSAYKKQSCMFDVANIEK